MKSMLPAQTYTSKKPRVAIVHDFLLQMGGGEKVVEALHALYPDAPVFTSAYDRKAMPARFGELDIRVSFLQKLPCKRFSHRLALLLYPMAFESLDLRGYDVVLSVSSAFAKGIITAPETTHICYTLTPMRYAWASGSYLRNEKIGKPLRALLAPGLHYLRTWDAVTSHRVDKYVAISQAVADRITKCYRRESEIVYPPVDIERFQISPEIDDYYIMVSRFVPYKRLDLAIEAFTRMGKKLKVVGAGRQLASLRAKAGPTIEFMGRVPDSELPGLLARARAFIMPGEEDFGIAPVEANACGRPVVAFAAGGALDTQIEGVTGTFFHEQTVEALCAAVNRADAISFDPQQIRESACRFDIAHFQQGIDKLVRQSLRPSRATAFNQALDAGQAMTLPIAAPGNGLSVQEELTLAK